MLTPSNELSPSAKRVGVLVVAYNAATTLAQTLDRLPESFIAGVDHILIGDDAGEDDTHAVATAYQRGSELPLTVVRHPQNLGYGGNQKAGYAWAIAHGLDVVVLLHGDGQYAPEVIESVVDPLLRGDADAVFGSRMLTKGVPNVPNKRSHRGRYISAPRAVVMSPRSMMSCQPKLRSSSVTVALASASFPLTNTLWSPFASRWG